MHTNSTFSLVLEGYEYRWKILNLVKLVETLEPVLWEIPDSFLEDWTWDNDSIEDHVSRCIHADTSYPIIVWDGRILDGCHRVIKLLAEGRREVKAKVIKNIPPPDTIIQAQDVFSINPKHSFKEIIKIVKNRLNQ